MKEVYVSGRRIRLDPSQILGSGGEAEIYNISDTFPDTALKIWKPPTHPDFQGADEVTQRNREGAKLRITEHQAKIRAFPQGMPPRVVVPRDLATSQNELLVVGYTMPLVSGAEALRLYGQLGFRRGAGVANNDIVQLFRELRETVEAVHGRKVVIGDFNHLNVLVRGLQAFLIDADSFQYGGYKCRTFTSRFVDPLICDPKADSLVQIAPHSEVTDWYAFALMLFECLLLTEPYGGMYEPAKKAARMPKDQRPLKRISVLHKEVKYPSKAIPIDRLPDDLLQFYTQLLERDARGEFPKRLLDSLRWTTCTVCGTEHARRLCPSCQARVPQEMVIEVLRGQVSLKRVFRTGGTILRAALQDGVLRYLYHESGTFRREDGSAVLEGDLHKDLHFRLNGAATIVAVSGEWISVRDGQAQSPRQPVEQFRQLVPSLDANAEHVYWVSSGRLVRDDAVAPKEIGQVLRGQTWFAVGPSFGFGFYRAGGVQVAFVFNAESPGIKDTVALPALPGELLDAVCYFSGSRCWFFAALNERGRVVHRCFLIREDGTVVATASAEEGDGTWLSSLRGKCAATLKGSSGSVHCLFAVSDDGLVRIQEHEDQIVEAAKFPDTKGLIDFEDGLFFASNGLYVVDRKEVKILTFRK